MRTHALALLEELKAEVARLQASHGFVPGLAVVIVGERSDSQVASYGVPWWVLPVVVVGERSDFRAQACTHWAAAGETL